MNHRNVKTITTAHRQQEGAGFIVRRPFPTRGLDMVDPFLLLDEMGPVVNGPGEAIGAPDHPHRGFETITYILDGAVEHKDSMGHHGIIGPGDVQWMTAGSGVVHSEMPTERILREGGRVHGFQIWLNLPKANKMARPRYQERSSSEIPEAVSADGKARVKVIAGKALGVSAAISTHSPIHYHHWQLAPGGDVEVELPEELQAFAYVFEGAVDLGSEKARAEDGQLARLGDGNALRMSVPADAENGAQLLLLAGKPLDEPVARTGPFVMNTTEELYQAMRDFRAGRMGRIAGEVA